MIDYETFMFLHKYITYSIALPHDKINETKHLLMLSFHHVLAIIVSIDDCGVTNAIIHDNSNFGDNN